MRPWITLFQSLVSGHWYTAERAVQAKRRKTFPRSVVSRGARTGGDRLIQVNRGAAAPFKVAVHQEITMYKRILVATDGSALSRKATRSAIDLAAAVGAELVAVNVVPRYPLSLVEGAMDVVPRDAARIEKEWAEHGQAKAEEVEKAAGKAGVKARAITVRSNLVAEAILGAARKNKCDLVVMASHGRKGIKRLLLGSETLHVLTHGDIPVLVLR
jgi:nucleotide-binding universal stress UspA family protein